MCSDIGRKALPAIVRVAYFGAAPAYRQQAFEPAHFLPRTTQFRDAFRATFLQTQYPLAAAKAGKQLQTVHRLAQKIIRARGKCGERIGGLGFCGDHDDIGVRVRWDRADSPADMDAVESRHLPVEQRDLRRVWREEDVYGCLPVVGDHHIVSVPLKKSDQAVAGPFIIFHDEHACLR